MTDNQPLEGHIMGPTGTGSLSLVVLDMTGEAPFLLTDWAGVLTGAGSNFDPILGQSPNLSATGFDAIWHRTFASLMSDPGGEGLLGFDGQVWVLPAPHTDFIFGSITNLFFATRFVAGDVGGQQILIDGGYLAIRPRHPLAEGSLESVGSTEPIGPGAPADLHCVVAGSTSCITLPRRHGWRIEGTLVPEPGTALLLGSGLAALAVRRKGRA